MLNDFIRQHLAHIRTAGRITHGAGATAHQADGTMTCPLHVSHGHERYEMTRMQAVSSGIKTYIKGNLLLIKQFPQFLLIGALGYKAAFFQNVKYVRQPTRSFIL